MSPCPPSHTLFSTWGEASHSTVGVSGSHRPRHHLREVTLADGPHRRRSQVHVGRREGLFFIQGAGCLGGRLFQP